MTSAISWFASKPLVDCWLWSRGGAVRKFTRLRGAGRPIARWALVLVLGFGSAAAFGDELAIPKTIVVFGDSQAQGLADGLSRVLVEDARYRVLNRTRPGAALVHGANEWLAPIERFTSFEKADIAVVMFGANDRLSLHADDGSYLQFRTGEWRVAYAARVEKILTVLANAGLRVIWCGNPIARNPAYSADMGYLNDIFAQEAGSFGGQFISLWTVIADDQGRYAAYGNDRDGTTERLAGR
jgi:uncharacterized protein